MRRIWFYPPDWYGYGWRTLVPVFLGTDELNRATIMLGWTITGRVVIAYGTAAVREITELDEKKWRERALMACAELCRWNPETGQCHSTQAQHAADAVLEKVVRPLWEETKGEWE